jgi:ABC-2 type transport system permease protein
MISLNIDKVPAKIVPEVRMEYNPGLKGVFMFVPGIMAMLLMLISALMTSLSITREKELGTMELLLASPLRPTQIIIGKVIPYVLLAFIDACIILAMGKFVFGVPIEGSVVLVLAESLLYIIMALSVGIMISSLTSSQQVAMTISLVALMLPTILLSGFIFPIANMPLVIQWLTCLNPLRYFLVIIRGVFLKGIGPAIFWPEMAALLVLGLATLWLASRRFQKTLA